MSAEQDCERNALNQSWTCDEINSFVKFERAVLINNFVCKAIQFLAFSMLIAVLVAQRCQGNISIGKLPILISAITVLESIFSSVRVYAIFQVLGSQHNYDLFVVSYSVESICFFVALWLFAAKYYETALDL